MLDSLQTAVSFREGTARPWVTGTSGQGGASAGSYSWSGEPHCCQAPPLTSRGRDSGRLAFHGSSVGLEPGRFGGGRRVACSARFRRPRSARGAGELEVGIVLLFRDKWLAWKRNFPRLLDPGSVLFWHFGIRGNHAVMSAPGGTGKRDAVSRPRPASAHSQPSCASG